jgi:uncharacterized membrane protein
MNIPNEPGLSSAGLYVGIKRNRSTRLKYQRKEKSMDTVTFIYTLLHTMAVVVLMGGGIFHAWILDPAADKALSPPDLGKLGMAIGKVWLVTAWTNVIVILVSGILLTERVGALRGDILFHTTYGMLIITKTAITVSWLVTASIITALAGGVNKMISSGGPPTVEKIQASVARMKLLSKTNCVTGLIAIVLAISLRL